MSERLNWRCEHGIHAYRTVWVRRNRLIGIPNEPTTWEHYMRCKRCYYSKLNACTLRYPQVKAYNWITGYAYPAEGEPE